ncbi:MAG TPA: hypothetical protein VNM14_17505 [Planctomycetota bacterium]|nr:hypothetical protein [Planctomycetota bacterium]
MTEDLKTNRIDDVAFYNHLRARVEHEDNLIVNRSLWLMAAQSFLFTAYAIAMNGPEDRRHGILLRLLPLVAVISSAMIFVGVAAAVRAMVWLRGALRERVPDESRLGLPPLQTPGGVNAGLAAPLLLPPVFVVVWVYLLCTS